MDSMDMSSMSMDHDHMDPMATTMSMVMESMTATMTMAISPTNTAASPMNTSMSGMGGMGGMAGMGHGGMGNKCKISMLWNWNTVGTCFITSSWHVTSHGMFAGSCIGVICLVICLEFLRRIGREYDAFIIRRARLKRQFLTPTTSTSSVRPIAGSTENAHFSDQDPSAAKLDTATHTIAAAASCVDSEPVRPNLIEQLIRAVLHMFQFAVAYFIMLLAMYFNGYIIICIFIGALLGSFIFSWEPLGPGREIDVTQVTKCCG